MAVENTLTYYDKVTIVAVERFWSQSHKTFLALSYSLFTLFCKLDHFIVVKIFSNAPKWSSLQKSVSKSTPISAYKMKSFQEACTIKLFMVVIFAVS